MSAPTGAEPDPCPFLLWDFGDTIVDQTWLGQAPDGVPEWSRCWELLISGEAAEAWFAGGGRSALDQARLVSAPCGMAPEAALEHMKACSRRIRFFDGVMRLVRESPLRQAIVTVNPDIFSEVVVPHYGLGASFEVIVTSWEERTNDKAELCSVAMRRLDPKATFADGFLIGQPGGERSSLGGDGRSGSCLRWRGVGGRAYARTVEAVRSFDETACTVER